MDWKNVCKERLYYLLRFGDKNEGAWSDCGHVDCDIPNHEDVSDILSDAELGAVAREYKETNGCWPGNNDFWWDKFDKASKNKGR